MPALSPAQLASASDHVVLGTVGQQETTTKTGRLLTETQVLIKAVWYTRPNAPSSLKPEKVVTVTQTGGATGTVRTVVRGDAQLQTGQQVLLFLFEGPQKRFHLTQLGLGAFVADGTGGFVQVLTDDLHQADGARSPAPVERRFTADEIKAGLEATRAAASAKKSN